MNFKDKELIAFDLDSTLAASKSAITDEMSELLGNLLAHRQVAVISGGKFEQFQQQLISNLKVEPELLQRLHLLPTNGTRYYRFEPQSRSWQQAYSEDLASNDRQRIISVLSEGAKELGLWEEKPYGEIIEDRASQITYSALGQQAPLDAKLAWDPDRRKKEALRAWAATRLPEFEVRIGGKTSVDVTAKGIDKAYGMRKLQQLTGVDTKDMLFIGDELQEGGNDYPVKAAGIDTLAVKNEQDTASLIKSELASLSE